MPIFASIISPERRHQSRRADDRKLTRFERWVLVYIGGMTLLAVATLVSLISAFYGARMTHFSFDFPTYTPRDSELCPGETLQVDLVFTVTHAPLFLEFADSWYNLANDINVVYGVTRSSIRTEVGVFPRVWEATVPDLTPGAYEYRLGAREALSPVLAFSAPFTVPEGCP